MELEKNYEPKKIESKIYDRWMKNHCFDSNVNKDKKPFTIVMPPPNVTGKLHMGHALDIAIQDAIIRYKRMCGYEVLWQAGTDHAAISTEVKVSEKLKNEGIDKYELGREGFLKEAWAWKEKYENNIIKQQMKIGASCDWSRKRFTMDEGCSKAVLKAFKILYDKGLIYKGNKMINWCPNCHTSISDAEVEYEEQKSFLYYIKYFLEEDNSKFIVVATTRPETILGDTAVAVNPTDERYKNLIGKKLILPLVGRTIPIVADEYVDKEFGTGFVKITPSHDVNDYEVGKRHNLESICILDDNGNINYKESKYNGLDRFEARKIIVEDLKKNGNIEKIEEYMHNVGVHDRCHTVIEPMEKSQWFVKMDTLAKPAIDVINNGDLSFIPDNYKNTYLHWLNNIKDWCISRQIWWGHRIPVYYCEKCGHINVSDSEVKKCEKCGCEHLKQDEDTLDTWFSSALWPFSTLGWPEDTPEYKYFYPTDVLVTGYDIIFFWVIRMVFSGLEYTGKSPFKEVLIHGIVRDELGRKMSKTLGNGIDPLDIVDKYGADALRISLLVGNAPGNDMRFYEDRVEAARNFLNKLWNATRFIKMADVKENNKDISDIIPNLYIEDKWIIGCLNNLIKEININMKTYDLGVALSKIQKFIWEEFCDWYIEFVKYRIYSEDEMVKQNVNTVLTYVLVNSLKLLHPFAPFVTEEIYNLFFENSFLILEEFPKYFEKYDYKNEINDIECIKNIIYSVRGKRKELDINNKKKSEMIFVCKNDNIKTVLEKSKKHLENMCSASDIKIVKECNKNEYVNLDDSNNYIQFVFENVNLYIPYGDLIDIKVEIENIKKEIEKNEFELNRAENMINNKNFISKAPSDKVKAEEEKIIKYKNIIKELKDRLNKMTK